MCIKVALIVFISLCTKQTWMELRDFKICHEDFSLKPADGPLKELTFPWLGFVQYVHMTSGKLHNNKAPRVVLIHIEFVIGTARDLLHQPKGYKLGHVVFGEYERNEADCGLNHRDIRSGIKCPRAYIEVSIRNLLPHPEFSRRAGSSCKIKRDTLMKMRTFGCLHSPELKHLPCNKVCSWEQHNSCPITPHNEIKKFCMNLNSTAVPRDISSEKMAKKTLKLYTHRECKRHRNEADLSNEGITHMLCSSGCGVRPGAPIISQSTEGRFELVGLAVGGAPCSDKSMRQRLNPEPPLYIDLFPYSSWIINVITAHRIPKPYPDNFEVKGGSHVGLKRSSAGRYGRVYRGWKGRMFVIGSCYKSLNEQKRKTSFFYTELFEVKVGNAKRLHVDITVHAGKETIIECARLIMQNRVIIPKVTGIYTSNITVKFDGQWYRPYAYVFQMGLSGSHDR